MEPFSIGLMLLGKTAIGAKVFAAAKAAFVSIKASAAAHATWVASGKIAASATLAYAGSVARENRREAARLLHEAKCRWQQAHCRADAAEKWVGSLVQGIEITRIATVTWGVREVRQVAREQGLLEMYASRFPNLLGGGAALAALSKLPSKLKKRLTLSQLDDASILAAYASLGIVGVQYIDRLGLVKVPTLRESLHDFVANLPIDGASQLAAPFTSTTLAVGDVLWGGLAGLGVWRLVANKKAARKMADDAEQLDDDVQLLNAQALVNEQRGCALQTQLQELKDSAFAIYEAIAVQRSFYDTNPVLVRASRDIFASQLSERIEKWQFQLQRDAVAA